MTVVVPSALTYPSSTLYPGTVPDPVVVPGSGLVFYVANGSATGSVAYGDGEWFDVASALADGGGLITLDEFENPSLRAALDQLSAVRRF